MENKILHNAIVCEKIGILKNSRLALLVAEFAIFFILAIAVYFVVASLKQHLPILAILNVSVVAWFSYLLFKVVKELIILNMIVVQITKDESGFYLKKIFTNKEIMINSFTTINHGCKWITDRSVWPSFFEKGTECVGISSLEGNFFWLFNGVNDIQEF